MSSSSSSLSSSSSNLTQANVVYGDDVPYEGETYKTVKIGSQIWFQRNLNYAAEGSKCYDNDQTNCVRYGRLYNWATAMDVCPTGWHLPNDAEWTTLIDFVGSLTAGTKLKATSGWNSRSDGSSGNGTDDFGFFGLPGGHGQPDGFFSAGKAGDWWSANEYDDLIYAAYIMEIYFNHELASSHHYISDKGFLHSVRCVKD